MIFYFVAKILFVFLLSTGIVGAGEEYPDYLSHLSPEILTNICEYVPLNDSLNLPRLNQRWSQQDSGYLIDSINQQALKDVKKDCNDAEFSMKEIKESCAPKKVTPNKEVQKYYEDRYDQYLRHKLIFTVPNELFEFPNEHNIRSIKIGKDEPFATHCIQKKVFLGQRHNEERFMFDEYKIVWKISGGDLESLCKIYQSAEEKPATIILTENLFYSIKEKLEEICGKPTEKISKEEKLLGDQLVQIGMIAQDPHNKDIFCYVGREGQVVSLLFQRAYGKNHIFKAINTACLMGNLKGFEALILSHSELFTELDNYKRRNLLCAAVVGNNINIVKIIEEKFDLLKYYDRSYGIGQQYLTVTNKNDNLQEFLISKMKDQKVLINEIENLMANFEKDYEERVTQNRISAEIIQKRMQYLLAGALFVGLCVCAKKFGPPLYAQLKKSQLFKTK